MLTDRNKMTNSLVFCLSLMSHPVKSTRCVCIRKHFLSQCASFSRCAICHSAHLRHFYFTTISYDLGAGDTPIYSRYLELRLSCFPDVRSSFDLSHDRFLRWSGEWISRSELIPGGDVTPPPNPSSYFCPFAYTV